MSDRPTPPPPDADPERPDQTTPAAADDTAVLPQGAVGPDVSTTAEGAPGSVRSEPAGHPAPGAQAPGAPVPDWSAAAVSPAPARSAAARRWWGEATSTGGGRAALTAVAVLGTVVLLAGVALLGGAIGRAGWGHQDRVGFADQRFSDGPGRSQDAPGRQKDRQNGKQKDGRGLDSQGGQQQRGNGNGMGNGMPDGMPNGMPDGMGQGLGRGLGAMGAGVLHGEFTTSATGTPTVMVVQTGEVTTYTSGRSLGVRSSDGFEATYALDSSIVTPREATRLATGAQVRVIAAKEGMKVTALFVIG